MCDRSSSHGRHPGFDLELCLLNIPTPIIVVCQSLTVVYTNRAAEKLLSHEDPVQSPDTFAGTQLADLDICLLNNETWENVFDKHDSTERPPSDDLANTNMKVREVGAVVEKQGSKKTSRQFRILLSSFAGDDGISYILSFEQSLNTRINPFPQLRVSKGIGAENKAETAESYQYQRYRAATFHNSNFAGYIISSDGSFYIPNKKVTELFVDLEDMDMHENHHTEASLEFWDAEFRHRMGEDELPGRRIVKTRKSYEGCRYGLIVSTTGAKYVLSASGHCLYDDEGQLLGGVCWFTSFQVLSDYVASERQKNLRSHEAICNSLPHMIWTTLENCTEADWFSKRWYDYTGMTEEEAVGIGFAKAFHPDDYAHTFEILKDHVVSKTEFQLVSRFRRRDGLYRWVLARGIPLLDDDNNILRWYGTNTDIHETTIARLHADSIKDQIMAVLAHANVSFFAINKEGVITMAEGQALSIIGQVSNRDSAAFVGMDTDEFSGAVDCPGSGMFENNLHAILAGEKKTTEFEKDIGDHVFRTRMVANIDQPKSDDEGKPAVNGVWGLVIDVTDMKARAKLELDNARLMAEEQAAKDSNRMKSQFLANMSHELRTPTSGVIGMVDLLNEDPTLSAEQRESVNSIQLSARALLTIVNDILDFSKIESGRFDIEETPFNLATIVEGLCQLLTMFANQKGLDFVYENSLDAAIEYIGDAGRIRQVLSNLLMNALKFTRKGQVKITISGRELESKMDDYDTLEVKFLIEDTGIGIEKKVLESLFTPFYQGDASTARLYGGTGLGLTISQNLARLMHGSIELVSTPTVGSTATFTLPLKVSSWSGEAPIPHSPEAQLLAKSLSRGSTHRDILNQQLSEIVTSSHSPQSVKDPQENQQETDGGVESLSLHQRSKINLLLVEDNAINQKIASKIIRKLGFPITAVWNGQEALDYLLESSRPDNGKEGRPPRPDIILMDVQMPVMDGYEATRILKSGKGYVGLEKNNTADHLEHEVTEDDNSNEKDARSMRDVPVIAMTASAIQGDSEKCRAAGMDDYLPKPVDKDKLEEILVKWAKKVKH